MLLTKTLAPDTLELLKTLMQKPYLNNFRLVGGTALSMQIGHRISVDLDLFSNEQFDTFELKSLLAEDFSSFLTELERTNTLICSIDSIKVDFIRFRYEFAFPIIEEDGIRLADIRDIAPMKIDAISGRGKKKDFFDLYFLLQKYSMKELLELYQLKYKHTTIFHVIKSINYFADAEPDNDPLFFDKKLTWEKVKKTIIKEIQKIE
jgi:predicted nucleotidyltransferase component of viral defense system